jgi:hypothetical protein
MSKERSSSSVENSSVNVHTGELVYQVYQNILWEKIQKRHEAATKRKERALKGMNNKYILL